jgi:hypothetical protein
MNIKKYLLFNLILGLSVILMRPDAKGLSKEIKLLNPVNSATTSSKFATTVVKENAGGRPKKKPKMMQRGQKKKKEYEERPFNVDVFLGYAKNYASGDYIEYQKTYHTQGTEIFSTSGSISNFNSVAGGVQMRGFPFMDHEDFKSKLSGILGVGYLRKGFTNDVQLQNNSLNYTDITQLKEVFRANYLTTCLMVRYGRLIFLEAGINFDIFINGARSQQVVRTTSGENAYKEPFSTSHTANFTLSSKVMSSFSMGFVGGIGYQIHPLAGIRISATINSHFFKEDPNFTNFQPSIQAFFTMN